MQTINDLWKTTIGKLAVVGGGMAGLISICFVCTICSAFIGNRDDEQVPNIQRLPTTASASTPVSSLSFADIVQHPDEKSWTDTQYSTYFDTINGQPISGWSGTILEIDEYAGEPYLSLDMKPGEPEIDAYVYIKEDDILKVSLGQNIVFAGTIDSKWSEPNGFNALQIKEVTLLELSEIPTQTPVPTNTPEPTVTPIPPTDTPIPEPTVTPIPEVENPSVTANENDVNIRSGPDTGYDVIGTLSTGESLDIIGRNADSSWWQVSTPNGVGWIFAGVATASNVDDRIPVMEAPPASIPTEPPPIDEPTPELPTAEPVTTEQPPVEACDCSGNNYNCPDFSTHASAQGCYEYCISIGRGDVHGLDRDNDGTACDPSSW